jgi:hypothetical protein
MKKIFFLLFCCRWIIVVFATSYQGQAAFGGRLRRTLTAWLVDKINVNNRKPNNQNEPYRKIGNLFFLLLLIKKLASHDVKDSAGTGVAGATVGSVLDIISGAVQLQCISNRKTIFFCLKILLNLIWSPK